MDLSVNNLKKARSFLKEESSSLKIEFHGGNFFNLSQDLLVKEYTHVWAQVINERRRFLEENINININEIID